MATWLPLESNPEVLTKFIHELGVSKLWALTDVFGMEPEYLEWVPKPVKAVILLCPCSENFEQFCKEEEEMLKMSPPDIPNNLYYMKQYIHNACGTIALLHAIANNPDIEIENGSKLKNFFDETNELSPEERGKMLQNSNTISETHSELAQEGQTEANLNEPVNHHFVAFVEHNGELFELDGRKSSPIPHGKTSPDSLLIDAAKVCRSVINRDPEDLRFSVIALTPNTY